MRRALSSQNAGFAVLAAGLAVLVAGCGKPAPPPAAKPAAKTAAAAPAAASSNAPTGVGAPQYASVFEFDGTISPPECVNPFFPGSHMFRTATPVATAPGPVRVDPVLKLQMVTGSQNLREAVINGVTFETGETGTVRVPDGRVKIKIITIEDNRVQVQVIGEAEPRWLYLGQSSKSKITIQ